MNKRILTVASSAMGGSGIVAYRLSNVFSKNKIYSVLLGFEKPFLSTHESGESSSLIIEEVDVFKYPLFKFELNESSLVESIVNVVLKHDITEVHAHYSFVYGFASIQAREILKRIYRKNVKVVLVCHGTDVIGYDARHIGEKTFLHYNKYVLNEADYLVCASEALKILIKNIYGIDRNIIIIPNFFDKSIFFKNNAVNRDLKSIIHISNFREVKRPDFVIDIFYRVKKFVNDAKLFLVGDGPLKDSVLQKVRELKIDNNVYFIGKINNEYEMASLLNKSGILLHPSLFENFSLTCLEALACGVPVVSSNAGGLPELIKSGHNGFTVDIDEINLYVQKIIEVMQSESKYQMLSYNAIKSTEDLEINKIYPLYVSIVK